MRTRAGPPATTRPLTRPRATPRPRSRGRAARRQGRAALAGIGRTRGVERRARRRRPRRARSPPARARLRCGRRRRAASRAPSRPGAARRARRPGAHPRHRRAARAPRSRPLGADRRRASHPLPSARSTIVSLPAPSRATARSTCAPSPRDCDRAARVSATASTVDAAPARTRPARVADCERHRLRAAAPAPARRSPSPPAAARRPRRSARLRKPSAMPAPEISRIARQTWPRRGSPPQGSRSR